MDALGSILHFGAYIFANMCTTESPRVVPGIVLPFDAMVDCAPSLLDDYVR